MAFKSIKIEPTTTHFDEDDDDIEFIREVKATRSMSPNDREGSSSMFEEINEFEQQADSTVPEIYTVDGDPIDPDGSLSAKIDDLLSWFVKLKPEYYRLFYVKDGSYLADYTRDKLVVEIEKCCDILDEYRSGSTLEQLSNKYELDSEDIVVVAICLAILDEANQTNMDFSNLCMGRVDGWAFHQTVEYMKLDGVGIKDTSKYGPMKLMQYTLLFPANTVLVLTLVWLKAMNFPLNVKFPDLMLPSSDVESTDFGDEMMQYAEEHLLNSHAVKVEDAKFHSEISDAKEAAQKSKGSIDVYFNKLKELEDRHQMEAMAAERDAFVIDTEIGERLLSDEERAQFETSKKLHQKLTIEMDDYLTQIREVRSQPNGNLREVLHVQPGEYVMARVEQSDSSRFELAKVHRQIDAISYELEMDEEILETYHIRDIATTDFGLFHPIVQNTELVGLRVVFEWKDGLTATGEVSTSWVSGIIGARPKDAKDDKFLVFLDGGADTVVRAPHNPLTAKEAGLSLFQKPCFNDKDATMERANAMKMLLVLQQSYDKDGVFQRSKAAEQLRERNTRFKFVNDYMNKYPSCPLFIVQRKQVLQIAIPGTVHCQNKLRLATVLRVEGEFIWCRFIQENIDCTAFPCLNPRHRHEDEYIYRGSWRMPVVQSIQGVGNNYMSDRFKSRLLSQIEWRKALEEPSVNCDNETKEKEKAKRTRKPKEKKEMDASQLEIAEKKRKEKLYTIVDMPTPMLPPFHDVRPHDQCDPDCLKSMDADANAPRFFQCSPLHVPMMCGWRRHRSIMRRMKRNMASKKWVQYYAPCGKPLNTFAEINSYLDCTRSQLTIDCFSFEYEIETEKVLTVEPKYLVSEDFSNKCETIPIPLVNSVNQAPPPVVEYARKRFTSDDNVNIDTINSNFCSGCTCDGDCSDASKCECQQLTKIENDGLPITLKHNKPVTGYTNRNLPKKLYGGIYECNDKCSCNRKCHNRVVQNNIKYPMQIFQTALSGWGVRAMADIPIGTFLCNYVGALLTNDIAEDKQDEDQYFADLDLNDTVEKNKGEQVDPNDDDGFGEGSDSDMDMSEEEEEQNADDTEDSPSPSANQPSTSALPVRVSQRNEKKREKKEAERQKKRAAEEKARAEADQRSMDALADQTESVDLNQDENNESGKKGFRWNKYFKDTTSLFVVDAKQRGNLGRFLNHSCDPNTHVQHVLYDTHDLRLPWVSFFTMKNVKAGEELTWDYSYVINRDQEDAVQCNCGSNVCRGRLL